MDWKYSPVALETLGTLQVFFCFQDFFFIFGCAGFPLLSLAEVSRGLLSSCGGRASCRGGFSYCEAQAVRHTGFRSCSQACELQRPGCLNMWDLPGAGTEPVFPSLPGGFLITEPFRGSPEVLFLCIFQVGFSSTCDSLFQERLMPSSLKGRYFLTLYQILRLSWPQGSISKWKQLNFSRGNTISWVLSSVLE